MPAPGGIYKQLVRQWRILALLDGASRGLDRECLAERFEVSEKTIGRDMEHLEQAGFGILRGKEGKRDLFRLGPSSRRAIPRVELTVPELAALQLARARLVELAPEPYYPALSGAFEKLGVLLTPETQRYCRRIERLAEMHPRGVKLPRPRPDVLDVLTTGVIERRLCTIRYRKPDDAKDTSYTLAPHRLLAHKGGLYVLTWHPKRAAWRTLAAERIRRAELTDRGFDAQPEEAIDAELAKPFGIFSGPTFDLEVRFVPEVVPFVTERLWFGTSEEKIACADGSLVYRATVSGDLEVEGWVLSFGANAEVLAPEWLRERVRTHARRILGTSCDAAESNPAPDGASGQGWA